MGNPKELVQKLYMEENKGKAKPSGSQDMIGIIHPGINRLDYDFTYRKGVFPRYIESCNDPQIAGWLEKVIHVLPVAPRPKDTIRWKQKTCLPNGFHVSESQAGIVLRLLSPKMSIRWEHR